MTEALLAVGDVALAAAVVVCGAILWELRRARLEANARGDVGKALLEREQEMQLLVEEEQRRIRKAIEKQQRVKP